MCESGPKSIAVWRMWYGPRESGKSVLRQVSDIYAESSMFNQSVEKVAWPASLQQLTFGKGFN